MTRILRREAAKSDLKEIWKYIASDSRERANDFLRALNDKMETLAKNPLMGRERDEVMPGLRSFPFKRYVIFYQPLQDGIDVIRVLHGARDIESLFD